MWKQRLMNISVTALLLTLAGIETAGATALGLADGSYNISFDFNQSPFSGTGSMTIVGPMVSSFHVAFPPGFGSFNCTGCVVSSPPFPSPPSPDLVLENDPSAFQIFQNEMRGGFLTLFPIEGQPPTTTYRTGFIGLPPPPIPGTWTATQMPEPPSISLLFFGLSALGLLGWLRRRDQ